MRYLILAPATQPQLDAARAAFDAIAKGPRAEHHTAPRAARSIYVLLETPDSPHVHPRVPVHATDDLLVFADGLPIHPAFDAFDARELARRWSDAGSVLGRHTLVRLDKPGATIELITDAIAACPPYRAQLPGAGWAITNIARLAHRLAEPGDLDHLGASGLACTPTLLADRTLLTTVRTVPCASRLTATPDAAPVITTHDRLIEAGRNPCDLAPDQAAERFASCYAPIITRLHDAGFDIRCALTGGRDSRALAALTATALQHPRYHFGGPRGAPESRTAERVAAILQGSFDLKADDSTPADIDYPAAERYLLDRDCGMIDLCYLRAAPPAEPDHNEHREVHLTGHAGEIARWSFESLTGTLVPPTTAASRQRLRQRMTTSAAGLFQPDAVRACHAFVDGLVDQALDAGVTRSNMQTVVANQLKAPRWAALHLARSAERRDVIAPFLTPPFFDLAMRIPPRDRFNDAFHKALIRRSAPDALKVPFHSYTNTLVRLRNELARNAMGSVPALKKAHARRKPPSKQAKWEPWLRPALRDRVLDHDRASPVWGIIDRTQLEAALTDTTGVGFKERVDPILAACTLVRFWDWYKGTL